MNLLISILALAAVIGGIYLITRAAFQLFKNRHKLTMLTKETFRYYTDKTLLRGHDFVASLWFDYIKDKDPDREVVAKIVAGATRTEKESGRKFDGRPIKQGWMTKKDFEDYFAFVDCYGSLETRYRILFQQTAYFKIKSTPGFEGVISKTSLQEPAENKGLRELAYEIRKVVT